MMCRSETNNFRNNAGTATSKSRGNERRTSVTVPICNIDKSELVQKNTIINQEHQGSSSLEVIKSKCPWQMS